MTLLFGLDLGTTTITALALAADGQMVAKETRANDAERTTPAAKARGYSEWDASRVWALAVECLQTLHAHVGRPTALGLTGQQHGCLLVDDHGQPQTPLINWQDQRANEPFRDTPRSVVEEVRQRVGDAGFARCGCRLANGYLATTLFWWAEHGQAFAQRTACFLPDFIAAQLTLEPPATDPTFAASAGIYDVSQGAWDEPAMRVLGLPFAVLPKVVPSGTRVGVVQTPALLAFHGVPVVVPMGDNQASVFGSIAEPERSILVNIGTGGQVSVVMPSYQYVPNLETRPFPDGYLLTSVGLAGGRAYAALEQFIRQIGQTFFEHDGTSVYETLNRLAAAIPAGADGLRCEPFFGGTRAEPSRRAAWTGISFDNLTAGHFARALLEGTAEACAVGHHLMQPYLATPRTILIGAGNGIRENPLLAQIIENRLGLPMRVPQHREEAAYGAALVAGVGVGVFPSWSAARKVIRYIA